MKRTKRRGRRTEAEIVRLVAGYESGGQSRAEYCATHGLTVTALDYYRRHYRPVATGLVEIDLRGTATPAGENAGVSIVLGNGRRVEIDWVELGRVPDHSQALRVLLALIEEA